MSFGKRQIKRNASLRPAPTEAASEAVTHPGIVAIVSIVVGMMGMATIYGVATRLRPAPIDIERAESSAANQLPATRQSPVAAAQRKETGSSAPTVPQKIVSKEQVRDDKGRVSQEFVQFADGTTETRDLSYSEAGKLERMTARSSDGRVSITVYTGALQNQQPSR